MGLVSNLYKLARLANDVRTAASLDPKRIVRRFVVNKFIGRNMAKRLYWKDSGKILDIKKPGDNSPGSPNERLRHIHFLMKNHSYTVKRCPPVPGGFFLHNL